jgi:hypothetical protein
MRLKGREAGMLGIDHQDGAEKAHEPEADPGVHGSQRADQVAAAALPMTMDWPSAKTERS